MPKHQLKAYFNVTNLYVLQKLMLLSFPFRHKSWQRLTSQQYTDGQTVETFAPPRDDINAPDLYIPGILRFNRFSLTIIFSNGIDNLCASCWTHQRSAKQVRGFGYFLCTQVF